VRWLVVIFFSLLWLSAIAVRAEPPADEKALEFFENRIRPVLVEHCYACHSAEAQKAGKLKGELQLDTRAGIRKGGETGPAVVPGDIESSQLVEAMRYEGLEMPPKGKLPDHVVADFVKWIQAGSPDPRDGVSSTPTLSKGIDLEAGRRHWAFQPPTMPPIPSVQNGAWPLGDIDRFILSRLEAAGLDPAVEADRYTLLRRLCFDLTGLPPSPGEIEAFVKDESPQAYEVLVDRLIASPAFGDRWGRHWLDLAQYADTIGLDGNLPDKNAWRYRDYVIAFFNEDKPFDQFVREQIAGDLMTAENDQSRAAQIVATAFLAQGPIQEQNMFKEQLRWDIIDNQVGKVGQVFLGLTMQCARCHDHKFDPVSQDDYYAMAGIFQNLQVIDGFLGKSKTRSATVRVPLPESAAQRATYQQAMAVHEVRQAELESEINRYKEEIAELDQRLSELRSAETSQDAESELAELDQQQTSATKKLQSAGNTWDDHCKANAPEHPYIFGAKEVTAINAQIRIRGNAHQLGREVARGFLQVLLPEAPLQIPEQVSGRLELAQVMTDPNSVTGPLTARVAVNRIWHHVFGTGLVPSVDNFGIRGEKPSHPELLDFLALGFMEQGWSVKTVVRQLVLSRTYRMASLHDERSHRADPTNQLLWRMNRRRLEAEAIRDTILLVSGQLDPGRGGSSLPLASWISGPIEEFVSLEGKLLPSPPVAKRRTVYWPVYRIRLPWTDGLMLFDAALSSVITGARPQTIAPTQSLYLMNSPFLIEQGKITARRLVQQHETSGEDRVRSLYLLALSRSASDEEVRGTLETLARLTAQGVADEEAWGMLCHAVFASNEFLMRF
jgi:hypothetical protein